MIGSFGPELVCTRGVHNRMSRDGDFARFLAKSVLRFNLYDWGEMCDEDKKLNDDAVATGEGRIFGSYDYKDGEKVWIITEADHSVTTILFPDEY